MHLKTLDGLADGSIRVGSGGFVSWQAHIADANGRCRRNSKRHGHVDEHAEREEGCVRPDLNRACKATQGQFTAISRMLLVICFWQPSQVLACRSLMFKVGLDIVSKAACETCLGSLPGLW